jgi:hypothetical protein
MYTCRNNFHTAYHPSVLCSREDFGIGRKAADSGSYYAIVSSHFPSRADDQLPPAMCLALLVGYQGSTEVERPVE